MQKIKDHWQLALLLILIFALWQTPVALPLKILVVFFHEFSHAITSILTGGEVISLSVSADQGGMVLSRGGNRFLTLTTGYLGSLLIGLVLLISALRTRWDRYVVMVCGTCLILVALLYVRDTFAFGFTTISGLLMIGIGWFLSHGVNDMLLRIIGLSSMIYVPYDILSDTILRSGARSDARMLAEEFGGTTVVWGGLWFALGLAVIFFALRFALREPTNLNWPSPKT